MDGSGTEEWRHSPSSAPCNQTPFTFTSSGMTSAVIDSIDRTLEAIPNVLRWSYFQLRQLIIMTHDKLHNTDNFPEVGVQLPKRRTAVNSAVVCITWCINMRKRFAWYNFANILPFLRYSMFHPHPPPQPQRKTDKRRRIRKGKITLTFLDAYDISSKLFTQLVIAWILMSCQPLSLDVIPCSWLRSKHQVTVNHTRSPQTTVMG